MKGFVNFHGGLKTPEGQNYSETTGAILILHGSVDPVSDMDDVTNLVNEINDFEIRHEVHIYGGVRHSFTIKVQDTIQKMLKISHGIHCLSISKKTLNYKKKLLNS